MRLGRRPYTVAIASYALALLGKDRFNPTQTLLRASAAGDLCTTDSYLQRHRVTHRPFEKLLESLIIHGYFNSDLVFFLKINLLIL